MIKIYCDRCGGECLHYHASLNINATATTGQGETLEAMYDSKTRHLCKHCKESLEQWYGKDLGVLSEDEMYQLKRQRMAEDSEEALAIAPGAISVTLGGPHP